MIAVSGSTGFIGSHLVKRFSEVIPITQEVLYQPLKLQELFQRENPEIIFHLASYGNHSFQNDPQMCVMANIMATFNILSASLITPYKNFVNFSTSSVLLPKETFYSATKAGGERICKAFVSQYKRPITIVRPYSVFGEGEADFRFIPTVCRALIKDEEFPLVEEPVHDWIYVGDFLDILLKNLDYDSDIGSGTQITNKQIVNLLEEISGKKAKIKKVENLRDYDSENWKSNQVRNLDLKKGLEKTYKYYEQKYK